MDVRLLLKKGIVKKKVGEGGFINYCYLKAVKRISFELNSYYICRPFSFWKALLLFRHNIFIEFFFQFDFLFYMFLIGVFLSFWFGFSFWFSFHFHFIFIFSCFLGLFGGLGFNSHVLSEKHTTNLHEISWVLYGQILFRKL